MADTPITLREWVDHLDAEQRRALEALARTCDKDARLLKEHTDDMARVHNEAHAREHGQNQQAIDKAEKSMDERLGALTKLVEAEFKSLAARSERDASLLRDQTQTLKDTMDSRLKLLEATNANLSGRLWALGVGVTFVIVAINVILRFMR